MQRTHSWIPRLFPPSIVLLTVTALALTAVSTEAQETPPSKLFSDGHFCQALLDELDALIPGQLKTFDVPGVGVALIDNGQVVYSKGFGVRNLQTGAPFTPDTVYRIGSVSKAMTSMLAATEVDAGLFNWNTVVRTLRPSFKLPTEQLTDSVEVHDLMGMGTGLADIPDVVYSDLFSPRYLWRALRTLPVTASPGTTFLYNNTVYAMGGYVGALAQGVPIPQLLTSYQSAMKTHLFDPVGMPTTAVTDHPQTLSDNFAVSYRYNLPDAVAPRHALAFQPIRAAAPAGAVASTLNDMERYLITQLQKGVAPNGARVVSAQNLQQTWQAQTKLNANFSYGMGWLTGSAYGMNILTHGGSIDSFETDVTMLPDSGIGIILFTNSSSGPFFYTALRNWTLQKLAGVPVTALDEGAQSYDKQKAYVQSLYDSVLSFQADCTQAGPFAGTYERGWTVEYDRDNTLWLTRGDYYRAALLQTARGYLVGTDEYRNVAWYVTLEQGKKARRLRITAVPADGSPEKLIDLGPVLNYEVFPLKIGR
jgi:CubicO group peptidase (beta-lactamase class C family)